MRKIWAVLLAVSLGVALSACSKCDVPDLTPKSCKGGTGPSQTLAGIWAATWAGNWD
jgi:predicted lipoprotein